MIDAKHLEIAQGIARQFTKEIPNYAVELFGRYSISISAIWSIYFACTREMSFREVPEGCPEFCDVPNLVRYGTSLFDQWADALEALTELLGDPEAFYVTGYSTAELQPIIRHLRELA